MKSKENTTLFQCNCRHCQSCSQTFHMKKQLKNPLFQQELTRLRNEAFSEALRG
jgi:hypothetical protein